MEPWGQWICEDDRLPSSAELEGFGDADECPKYHLASSRVSCTPVWNHFLTM